MPNVFVPPTDNAPNAEMTVVIDTATGDQWRVPTRAVEAILAAAGDIDEDRLAKAIRRARQAVAWTPEARDIAAEYRALGESHD